MADVVVDAKPKEQLPYDPNDIPEAVKKRVAAVEALYGQQPQESSSQPGVVPSPGTPEQRPPEAPVAQAPVPDASSIPTPVSPPAPAAPPPPEDENTESWKERFLRMQGRYNASQRTLAETQEQLNMLGTELLNTQRQQPQQPPPQPAPTYITDQDVQNYGSELLDFTRRAAVDTLAPHLQALNQQNAELQRRLAQEARHRLDQAVAYAIPNYLEIDRDPRWHNWLLGVDVYGKRVRQHLLDEAIATADAPRVIQFFKGFLAEEAATGHRELEPQSGPAATPPRTESALNLATLAAPGRTRPATGGDSSVPPEKPLYTRAILRQLYEQHRKGAFVGREAEWNRIDADIFAAGREGRIRT